MSTHRDIAEMEPRELVRWFMHGDRPSFKLGYDYKNASLAVADLLGRNLKPMSEGDAAELFAYARGFGDGMKDDLVLGPRNPYEPDEVGKAYDAGYDDGLRADSRTTYPA